MAFPLSPVRRPHELGRSGEKSLGIGQSETPPQATVSDPTTSLTSLLLRTALSGFSLHVEQSRWSMQPEGLLAWLLPPPSTCRLPVPSYTEATPFPGIWPHTASSEVPLTTHLWSLAVPLS